MRDCGLFTDRFAVQVDYPDITAGRPAKAARLTCVGHGRAVRHEYEARAGGGDSFDITLGFCEENPGDDRTETVPDVDSTALLRDGHISVTPVTADRTFGAQTGIGKELNRLRHFAEHEAPRP
ncbi:hypothetical protein AB0N06_24555 [Streptomyces sp. NPDC051020]|uniref:hypothetical protein n=1 Tax=Streptomyces sp. NPDC051020 TaxID=3155409 RepID=UPI003428376A